ncbi:hypothetical protein [Shinella zoogloeoides]|uniref:hypothetical protein n=1 Tax=Shinella zoogloeoides TaxID=352475 RepID=UPI001F580DE8|nr:hypothetical protein [Shinella zoogloeoides]
MTTPMYWRRPSFSVAETAEMIGSSEDALRTWMARCPLDEFAGEKKNGRIWLTGRDGYFYHLVQVLSQFGVPVRTAMYTAGSIAEYGAPTYAYLTVRTLAGKTEFNASNSKEADGPALVLPLLDLFEKHVAVCREYYAKEST